MSLFSTILAKLGIGSAEAAQAAPISTVDAVTKLEGMAATYAEKPNWKTSIVDLLKILCLDSSLAAREGLATELGCPAGQMGDWAQMNVCLHKTVMQKLAKNGSSIPKELLD